jgi:ABC-type multidrug transport system ATPase subunit
MAAGFHQTLLLMFCPIAAGKTTLLDTLAGRKATGKVSGQILVDGRELPPQEFR